MNLLPLGLAKAGASRPPLAVLDRNLWHKNSGAGERMWSRRKVIC